MIENSTCTRKLQYHYTIRHSLLIQKKQYRPILQTTEPAEVLRFAIDGFVEKFTNPQYHHVILRLDQPAFQKWSTYAHNLSHSHTKDFFTGQPTQVPESPSLSELAFVGTNTFLQIIELSKMFKGMKME